MILLVKFADGTEKRYDVKPLQDKWESFRDLAQGGLFNLVRVDKGGYGVIWNEYLDLACDDLWENGSAYDEHAMLLTNNTV
jgi:hypothetical protein